MYIYIHIPLAISAKCSILDVLTEFSIHLSYLKLVFCVDIWCLTKLAMNSNISGLTWNSLTHNSENVKSNLFDQNFLNQYWSVCTSSIVFLKEVTWVATKMLIFLVLLIWIIEKCFISNKKSLRDTKKQPSRGVLKKRCSENMQQIYRTTHMSKCDVNKVEKQLKKTSGWLLLETIFFHS